MTTIKNNNKANNNLHNSSPKTNKDPVNNDTHHDADSTVEETKQKNIDAENSTTDMTNSDIDDSDSCDAPIVYEDSNLFGKKAPVILLCAVISLLLASAFLKNQQLQKQPTGHVSIISESDLDDKDDKNLQEKQKDVVMIKVKEP